MTDKDTVPIIAACQIITTLERTTFQDKNMEEMEKLFAIFGIEGLCNND